MSLGEHDADNKPEAPPRRWTGRLVALMVGLGAATAGVATFTGNIVAIKEGFSKLFENLFLPPQTVKPLPGETISKDDETARQTSPEDQSAKTRSSVETRPPARSVIVRDVRLLRSSYDKDTFKITTHVNYIVETIGIEDANCLAELLVKAIIYRTDPAQLFEIQSGVRKQFVIDLENFEQEGEFRVVCAEAVASRASVYSDWERIKLPYPEKW